MRMFFAALAIFGALWQVILVAAGAHLDRWDAIFWPALLIPWIVLYMIEVRR